jgi:hypothetical protein
MAKQNMATPDSMPVLVDMGSHNRTFDEWMAWDVPLRTVRRICSVGDLGGVLEGWKLRPIHNKRSFDTDVFFLPCQMIIPRNFIEDLVSPLVLQDKARLFACDALASKRDEDCFNPCRYREYTSPTTINSLLKKVSSEELGWPLTVQMMIKK